MPRICTGARRRVKALSRVETEENVDVATLSLLCRYFKIRDWRTDTTENGSLQARDSRIVARG